ncbi:uncharacterized protein [Coffea arabica]|uniref:Uncharacterized protein n=1 Tax=Coffea arabica TaxID=13443 RepID=A0A6P6WRF5_COFAR
MFHNQTTVELQQHQLTEEEDKNKKKKKKKKKDGRLQSTHESRSPLQELNRVTSRRINPAKKNCCTATTISSSSSSICSSSSTSVSIDAPKCCLKFLLSSTSNSRPRSSSSSSSSHLQKDPNFKLRNKPLLTKSTPKSAPNSSRPRSNKSIANENDVPKQPTSQSFRKNPSFLSQWQSGRRPTSKSASQRSKLSSDLRANLKSPAYGCSGRFGAGNQQRLKQKYQQSCGEPGLHFNVADDLVDADNFTPVGKVACGPSLNYALVVDDDEKSAGEDSNSGHGTIVVKKTPPIEASLSPEIQCGGSSNPVLGSAATPVCYGAGHLISGVTDKRKCRARGILTIGGPTDSSDCGKSSFCKDDSNENADVLFTKSRTSLIPLPAEASMKWLLSPPGKEDEVQKDNNANSDSPFTGSASLLLSSPPSSCCQLSSDLVSDSGEKNGSGNQDATASTGKTRIVLLSPRRITNFEDFSHTPYEKNGGSLITPQTKFSCKTDNRQKGGERSYALIGKRTPSSGDPLSGSNIIQTPTSDSSPDRNVGISWISADDCQANEANPVVDSMAEIFHRISVSPRSQMQMWDPCGFSSQFTGLTSPSCSTDHMQLQQNLDTRVSWISDTTVGNLSLSQMRISWREGLVSRILDTDELDCCRCLSDEENYGDRSDELQHKSPKACGTDSLTNGNPRSPEFLEHEPEILIKGKEALSLVGTNICAESISTDAGGLVASGDSDWTLSYKNQLFEV